MSTFLVHLVNLLRAIAADRARLALENVALRQQLLVLKRTAKRPPINDSDRTFWILMRRILKDWRESLHIVKPETVIRWHRQGFRYYWRWKSRSTPGRPPIPMKVVALIQRMSRENPLWGSPHIQKELALLGHVVGQTTVEKYMIRAPRKPDGNWRSFIQRHMDVTAACDFLVVPTLTFKRLFCFVVLTHDRRRIVHINVTTNPTAGWTAQQIVEAFPGDTAPQFLIHDRDSIYGDAFRRKLKVMGIRPVRIGRKMPMMNAYCERVIGSIRRECTDHVIALGERHLLATLREFVAYYNEQRPHGALNANSPLPRQVASDDGDIINTPVLGGLHHTYAAWPESAVRCDSIHGQRPSGRRPARGLWSGDLYDGPEDGVFGSHGCREPAAHSTRHGWLQFPDPTGHSSSTAYDPGLFTHSDDTGRCLRSC